MIENLIENIAHSLGSWAYLLVAVMATAETAAFAGFIAPGEVTIIIGGVLAGEGTLSIQLLIGIVWASIVLGDSIGFMIGRKYGRNFLVKHGARVRLTEERLKQVEDYFKRHGGKTIFFGRWVGFVRPLMPFTAGTSGMPYRRFLPYDVLSAGLFGATFSLLGYIFWRNFNTVASIVGRGAIGLGILVALIVGGVWTFKRLRHEEQRQRLVASLERLGQRPALRPVAAVLRTFGRVALRPVWRFLLVPVWRFVLLPAWQVLLPPLRFLAHRLTPGEFGIEFTTLVAIAAVGGYVFGAYADVLNASPAIITPGDGFARDLCRDIENDTLTTVAKIVALAGGWQVAVVVLAIAMPFLIAARRWAEAAVLAVGMGLTEAAVYTTKAIVDRPRPADGLIDTTGSSFPSGHAATAVVYVALAFVVARGLRSRSAGVAVVTASIVLAAAVGLSRVYLRVHYMSDANAGWALALAVFSLCGCVALAVSYLRNNGRARRPGGVTQPASTTSDG